jgi:hypothetical protein
VGRNGDFACFDSYRTILELLVHPLSVSKLYVQCSSPEQISVVLLRLCAFRYHCPAPVATFTLGVDSAISGASNRSPSSSTSD